MIEVRLFATLRKGREKILILETENFSTVSDVLNHLGIKKEDVAISLVNGFHQNIDYKVQDEDVLAIFPPIGGG